MNSKAVFNNKIYTLVQVINNPATNMRVVLCKDECDTLFYFTTDEWISNNYEQTKSTFNKYSSVNNKINLFKSLFCTRTDVYAKRYYNTKTGASGYVPACANEWVTGVCDKKKYTCAKCPNRSFIHLSSNVIYNHLKGDDELCRDVIGVYPMTNDETTKFLAIDFDKASWQDDILAVRTICNNYNIPVAVERSRSGNGAHLWIFFEEYIPAGTARKLGSAILTKAMENRHELSFRSYDRMFPNQDTMPKGGFGNLIALPLQGKARKSGNSEFVDENFVSYPDQWEYLYNIETISKDYAEGLINRISPETPLGELVNYDDDKPWEKKNEILITPIDFTKEVKFVKSNMLYISKEGISQSALNKIKRLAAFKNPDFYKSQAMRLPVYNKPRIIYTSEETEKYLCIPRGCEEDLLAVLNDNNVKYIIKDIRNSGIQINVDFNGELREEQQKAALEILKYENGVLSATTAFGKTVVASYIISKLKVNTLILVHSSALLQQWNKSLLQFLTFNEKLPELPNKRGRKKKLSYVGLLGSGKNTINSKVDVAIMQSVVNGDEVKEFVKNYGMVIVDECHHVSAFTFEKILRNVNAKYVYGLTATPIRQDGHHPIIFMQCGPVRYKVDAMSRMIKRNFEHYLVPRFTEFRVADNTAEYVDLCSKLCADEARNQMIVKDVVSAYENGRNPIILTERKEHADILYNFIKEKYENVFILSGKDTTKEKRRKLEQISNVPTSENLIIIATGKYVGEGFDEPRLDTLFLAMPIAWKGTLAQYVGRLHREYDGKTYVCVYDYADIFVPTLDRMYHKRLKGYSELGYRIKDFDGECDSVIYSTDDYFSKFSDDIHNATKSVLIVSPKIQKSYLQKFFNSISDNVKLQIITKEYNKIIIEEIISTATENINQAVKNSIEFIYHKNLYQNFTVIDNLILWYGNINYLNYNYYNNSAIRLLSSQISTKMQHDILKEKTLFD